MFGFHCGYSMEIVTMLYSASLSMSAFFQNNLLLRKACNATVPFGECTYGEANAQHVVSVIHSWKAMIQYSVPVLLITLAGFSDEIWKSWVANCPWSDSHGRRRKPLVFIPIIGQILTDGLCILNVYFWNWPPHVAAIFEALTPGLFGARSMFWIGVITFISDNNPNELRTLKYGIINAIYTVSTLIGTGLAGFINVWLGFYGSFIISILFNLFGIMIVLNLIQENSTEYDKNVVWLKPKYFYRGYMNIFKKTTKYYTITIIALLLCQAVLVGRIGGEYAVTYFFIRYKFHWFEVKYSYFAAYKMMMIFFGTLFSVSVLSHYLKMNDAVIGFIACAFDMLAAVCYVFVAEPWQLYIIPIIDIFHGTALAITTSITSKLVDNDDFGKLNSVQAIMSLMLSFVLVSLYSVTYHFTFEYLAGAVFLLNIVFTFPLLIMFIVIYFKCKHLWSKEISIQCS